VVADRIIRFANALGRENVIAGVDCGFSSNINIDEVDSKIAWAKLRALSDGAALASKELWHG
jgi:5-methyltetrahydropteroyltriglutamate--homocysteine methyltransferase